MSLQNDVKRDTLDGQNQILNKLHTHLVQKKRFPHKGQARIIRAFFNDKKKVIMGQCGRSLGKTEAILYICWRYALLNPEKEIYIVCPQLKQGERIYWIPKRLQNYGPQEFVDDHRTSELRTVFKNGSYIMIVGCDNFEAVRGAKPHLVIYDEFQHHSAEFDEEVMQPNLSSGNVALLAFGTPPKRHCHYVDFREDVLDNLRRGNKNYFYAELHSSDNPTLDKEWLAEKKATLIRKGRLNVWLREYEGKLCFDIEHAVLPFYDKAKMWKPAKYLDDLIKRDKKKLNWSCWFDPGTATVFGVLLVAWNPYTCQVYILDEIYATEKNHMTASYIWEEAKKLKKKHYADEEAWLNYYDEAALWFANEVHKIDNEASLIPTHKKRVDKAKRHDEGRAGESLLNTIMDSENRFFVSENCVKFDWEITNYVTNEAGKYPTKHDHLMDLLFYFATESGYEFDDAVDPSELHNTVQDVGRNPRNMEQLFAEMKGRNDIANLIEDDFFDTEDSVWN